MPVLAVFFRTGIECLSTLRLLWLETAFKSTTIEIISFKNLRNINTANAKRLNYNLKIDDVNWQEKVIGKKKFTKQNLFPNTGDNKLSHHYIMLDGVSALACFVTGESMEFL